MVLNKIAFAQKDTKPSFLDLGLSYDFVGIPNELSYNLTKYHQTTYVFIK